ncbi:phage protein Gp27 family protein [Methylomicrobium sp. Wu6]|uniref:DUF3486 family protein n=1 Tax=Methylomicrobium sp. Wu6 TaxID=3107928 RepID=UPI002DD6B542|nr:phage protein Gp27 family protein [Methylomicrobium sp. Wu6]MEC4750004.1 phage protein Gp27 family protein [Methylomicrobium sp. Wu6]
MPRPSPIDDFTPEQRAAFEGELIRRNFKDYDGLVDWLKANGLEISRSAAYRHGSKLQRRLQAVRNSTEAAKLIAEAAPDDADLRSAAVISMVQSELFDVMVTLQDLDEAEPGERVMLLKEAARSVLDMTKASVLQKKWQADIKDKLDKAFSKLETQAGETQSGPKKLDADTLAAVRREVYGLV